MFKLPSINRTFNYKPLSYKKLFYRNFTTDELRSKFLSYFQKEGYELKNSSSLIPKDEDQSLLFINSGMVPFKKYFIQPNNLKNDGLNSKSFTSCQRCVRAGGKHNDLDEVGRTNRHLTFFEMLGNFSFGEKSELEAIKSAWYFLTNVINLPKERLLVTVLESDTYTKNLWLEELLLPPSQLKMMGKNDNFWMMGIPPNNSKLEYPCGPCTEIYFDLFPNDLNLDFDDKYVEVWNLVFMRYLMDSKQELKELKIKCIDTGMGLERLAAIVQNKKSAFEIDSIQPIITQLQIMHPPIIDLPNQPKRIIADHLRTISNLIISGIIPSNQSRGYVLRRIIRRCIKAKHDLQFPFKLSKLLPTLLKNTSKQFNIDLHLNIQLVIDTLDREEEVFGKALENGLNLLNQWFNNNVDDNTLPGEIMFMLFDRHGFPLDLTKAICNDRNINVDMDGFEKLLLNQKQSSKNSWKGLISKDSIGSDYFKDLHSKKFKQKFIGYDLKGISSNPLTEVMGIEELINEDGIKSEKLVMLNQTPFYGLGGGQANDFGTILLDDSISIPIIRLEKIENLGTALIISNEIDLKVGDKVNCFVDLKRRNGLTIHHSATHLVNLAIRKVLNWDINQAGSQVEPNSLRLDFTYPNPISKLQINQINQMVNDIILSQSQLNTTYQTIDYDQVQSLNDVITIKGETYPTKVRLVKLGSDSMELCTGTHVNNLLHCYPIKILSITSIASGIKRIEAISGQKALQFYQNQEQILDEVKSKLGSNTTDQISDKLSNLIMDNKKLSKKVDQLLSAQPNHDITKSYEFKDMIDSIELNGEFIIESQIIDGLKKNQLIKVKSITKDSKKDISVILFNETNHLWVIKNGSNYQKLHIGKWFQSKLKSFDLGQGGGSHDLANGKVNSHIKESDLLNAFQIQH